MQKLISIDLFADFGMLKKPDTNEPVYLTFNMIHKPALLGILGAIIGESGFKEKGVLPDYYTKLKDIKLGIEPLRHENGNFQKTIITYNNTTGMASKEEGGNLMITEQTLIAPAYTCYFLLETENETHQNIDDHLSHNIAEYLPYLGKNEFSVWWKNYRVYENIESFYPADNFRIQSVFIKSEPISPNKDVQPFVPFITESGNTFSYFERLPLKYTEIAEKQFQYEYRDFAFTDWMLQAKYKTGHEFIKFDTDEIIQVF
ncbi:MAG: type I-B CRISPR-associated protein Cas5b [Bacteroidota bacterium]